MNFPLQETAHRTVRRETVIKLVCQLSHALLNVRTVQHQKPYNIEGSQTYLSDASEYLEHLQVAHMLGFTWCDWKRQRQMVLREISAFVY